MKSSFNVVISVVVLAAHLVQRPAPPLQLCAAVRANPPLRVQWEACRVPPLQGSLLLRSHSFVLLLGRWLLFCSSDSASRTSAFLRLIELLRGLGPLLELLDVSYKLLEDLVAHRRLLYRAIS